MRFKYFTKGERNGGILNKELKSAHRVSKNVNADIFVIAKTFLYCSTATKRMIYFCLSAHCRVNEVTKGQDVASTGR